MLSSKTAVISVPVYLLVALITTAFSLVLFAGGVQHLWWEKQIHQVETELEKIFAEAEHMFTYADEGTQVTIHVFFPDTMRMAVFGDTPSSADLHGISNWILDENTSNQCYYLMTDGTMKTYHSFVRFSSENTHQISVLKPGSYDIILELEYSKGKTYVKIYKKP